MFTLIGSGIAQTAFNALTVFQMGITGEHNDISVSEVLLCAYGTMPLIVDLYVTQLSPTALFSCRTLQA
jgi:hypothetical protein